MRLAVVAALTLIFATPAFAEPSPAPRKAEALRYRTLEKMLRRFAAQAGTASSGKVFASR
jgi:hypothetical protein